MFWVTRSSPHEIHNPVPVPYSMFTSSSVLSRPMNLCRGTPGIQAPSGGPPLGSAEPLDFGRSPPTDVCAEKGPGRNDRTPEAV